MLFILIMKRRIEKDRGGWFLGDVPSSPFAKGYGGQVAIGYEGQVKFNLSAIP
jgi:hypothetical protein